MSKRFKEDKARVLGRLDLSRKGSADAAILPLLEFINGRDCYYTTSSCSGRLVVFSESKDQRKKGCHWLLVSHDLIELAQLEEVLKTNSEELSDEKEKQEEEEEEEKQEEESGYVYFKFEPFILHTMCATLSDAQLLLQTAIASGFRNSGMTCGKKERWMVAVRSTQSLEVPLALNETPITSPEYLRHIVMIGNSKLRENLLRIERFHRELVGAVIAAENRPEIHENGPPQIHKPAPVTIRSQSEDIELNGGDIAALFGSNAH